MEKKKVNNERRAEIDRAFVVAPRAGEDQFFLINLHHFPSRLMLKYYKDDTD